MCIDLASWRGENPSQKLRNISMIMAVLIVVQEEISNRNCVCEDELKGSCSSCFGPRRSWNYNKKLPSLQIFSAAHLADD